MASRLVVDAATGTRRSSSVGAGAPSGYWPTSAGRLMIPKRAMGSTTSQTASAARTHAKRQPTAPMTTPSTIGVSARRIETTVVEMPKAMPRRRSNHGVIESVLTRKSEPCPSQRMSTKPIAKVTKPWTALMAMTPAPNASPIRSIARRAPNWSIQRLTGRSSAAPTRVPMRYAAETSGRVSCRSSISGSTNTETPLVWPGPVITAVTVASARMRQPKKSAGRIRVEKAITTGIPDRLTRSSKSQLQEVGDGRLLTLDGTIPVSIIVMVNRTTVPGPDAAGRSPGPGEGRSERHGRAGHRRV